MTVALTDAAVHITAESALRYLLDVVKEKGIGHIYVWDETSLVGECHYTRHGLCACIVGHVLHKAGVTIPELAEMDIYTNASISVVPLPHRVTTDEHALNVLRKAQMLQDQGATWGAALQDAINAAHSDGYEAVAEEVQGELDKLRAVKP